MQGEKQIEKRIITSALGDDDIKYYLPGANILKLSDLKKYNSIEDLLPKDKSYAIILYETEPNKGHWTCISRYKNKNKKDVIEFFDSLADDGSPDAPLKWNSEKLNKKLGQGKPMLSELLNKSNIPVIYNKFKFQSEGNNKDGKVINTCGRHCIFRIRNLLDFNKTLEDYYKLLGDVKEDSGNTYDEIVSHLTPEKHN